MKFAVDISVLSIAILTLAVVSSSGTPLERVKRSWDHHSYPQIYTAAAAASAVAGSGAASAAAVSYGSLPVHAPVVSPQIYYTVRTLPAQTHTQTHVTTASNTLYRVSVPVTYTTTYEQPAYSHRVYSHYDSEPLRYHDAAAVPIVYRSFNPEWY